MLSHLKKAKTPSIKTSYNKLFSELERKLPRQKKLN